MLRHLTACARLDNTPGIVLQARSGRVSDRSYVRIVPTQGQWTLCIKSGMKDIVVTKLIKLLCNMRHTCTLDAEAIGRDCSGPKKWIT